MVRSTVFLVLIFLYPVSVLSQVVSSDLGYKLTIPDNMLYLSKKVIEEDPSVFVSLMKKSETSKNKTVINTVVSNIKNGRAEMLYWDDTFGEIFQDNINVQIMNEATPHSQLQAELYCKRTQKQIEQAFGNISTFSRCDYIKAGESDVVVTEFNGIAPGLKHVYFSIELTESQSYGVTATIPDKRFSERKDEFYKIMETFNW